MKRRFPFAYPLIALLLAVSVILPACSNDGSATNDTSGQTDMTTAAADTETTVPETTGDGLPTDLDLGGQEFRILCMKELDNYYAATSEDTGDILSSAVFARNSAVEARFGVEIVPITMSGMGNGATAFKTAITTSVDAMDGNYDVVAPNYWYGITLSAEGAYINLLDLPYLDFDNPWWAAGYNNSLEMSGKLYACTGDYDLQQYASLIVTFFNTAMIEKYQLDNPYDLVRSGDWTIDKMNEMAMKVSDDLDSNGRYNDNDQYGIIMNQWAVRGLYTAFGMDTITRNAEDEFSISLYTEKAVNAYEKMYDILMKQDYSYKSKGGYIDNTKMTQLFMNGQSLFFGIHLGAAEDMREMEIDYGIVPQPKWDKAQENYITGSVGATIFAVPVSAVDPDFSALILEALCMESYEQVVPVYYEKILKYRDARDEDTSAMIELARSTLYYDWGYVWNTSISNIYDHWGSRMLARYETMSWYHSYKDMYEGSLKNLLENLASVE